MTCQIAIVGAGPAGLSAAAHAQELGLSYVLLEGSPAHANTIQHYQKGKHVMAEPGLVPLRSALEFEAGSREQVLDEWQIRTVRSRRQHSLRCISNGNR